MLYYMWKSHWSQICGVQYLRSYSMWKILKLGTDRSAGLGYISFPIWCCKSATTTTDVHPSTRGLLIKHFSKTQTCLQKTLFRPLYSWNSVCIYCQILVCAKYYIIIQLFYDWKYFLTLHFIPKAEWRNSSENYFFCFPYGVPPFSFIFLPLASCSVTFMISIGKSWLPFWNYIILFPRCHFQKYLHINWYQGFLSWSTYVCALYICLCVSVLTAGSSHCDMVNIYPQTDLRSEDSLKTSCEAL